MTEAICGQTRELGGIHRHVPACTGTYRHVPVYMDGIKITKLCEILRPLPIIFISNAVTICYWPRVLKN